MVEWFKRASDDDRNSEMIDQRDNVAVPSRTTVRIPTASGDELEAWVYLLCGSMRTAILARAVADLVSGQANNRGA